MHLLYITVLFNAIVSSFVTLVSACCRLQTVIWALVCVNEKLHIFIVFVAFNNLYDVPFLLL